MKRYIASLREKAKAVAILGAIGLLGIACGGGSEQERAADPVLGLWSTESLFDGNLWVGYTPDGKVAYILNPSKAPGTLGNPAVVDAVYESTGRWSREGSVYKVVMSRGGREVGRKFYKLDGALLIECEQDGIPKAKGEEWSLKMPGDAETLEFITAYMEAIKEANAGK